MNLAKRCARLNWAVVASALTLGDSLLGKMCEEFGREADLKGRCEEKQLWRSCLREEVAEVSHFLKLG